MAGRRWNASDRAGRTSMSTDNTRGLNNPHDNDASTPPNTPLRQEIAELAPHANNGIDAKEALAGRYDNLRLRGAGQ